MGEEFCSPQMTRYMQSKWDEEQKREQDGRRAPQLLYRRRSYTKLNEYFG